MFIRFISPLITVAVLAACSGYTSPGMTSKESSAASSYTYPSEYQQLREVGWNMAAK